MSAVSFNPVRLSAAFFGAAVRDAAIVTALFFVGLDVGVVVLVFAVFVVRDPAFARPVSARDVPLLFDLVVLAVMILASLPA